MPSTDRTATADTAVEPTKTSTAETPVNPKPDGSAAADKPTDDKPTDEAREPSGNAAPTRDSGEPSVTIEGLDPRRKLPLVAASALAALSGTAMVAAFPPYGLWWLAPVAVALLAIATRGQRVRSGALLGALHGAAFFVPLLHWTGLYVGPLPWLLLAGLQTTFLCLLGAVAAGTSRFTERLPWAAPLVTAALWVGQEALRSRLPWGGFPWGRIAFSQDESPVLRLASIGGAPLATFAVALAGGFLAALVWPSRQHSGRLLALRGAALVGAIALVSLCGLAVPLRAPGGPSVNVAVIQGNVPRLGLDFNAQRRAVLENHVNATLALAREVNAGNARRPDLVIWPENSSDIDPLKNSDAEELINSAADEIQVPILVGAVLEGPGRYVSNAGIVWHPQSGAGEKYLKRHPVPFAEYMPLRSIARRVSDKVDLVRRDFKGGEKVGALKVGPATIGDVICFEVAYDALVRDTVYEGAQLLVVQTNNATFGKSAESAQQLAMVRLRAVEHGRPSIMASTSGVSATVDAEGRVLDESALFTQATFVRALALGEHRTLATTLSGWPEAVLAFVGLAALLAAGWLRWRAPRLAAAASGEAVEQQEIERPAPPKPDAESSTVKQHKEDA